jgi:hypothetical protein
LQGRNSAQTIQIPAQKWFLSYVLLLVPFFLHTFLFYFLFFQYFYFNQEHTKRKYTKFHSKRMQALVYRKTRKCAEKEKFNFSLRSLSSKGNFRILILSQLVSPGHSWMQNLISPNFKKNHPVSSSYVKVMAVWSEALRIRIFERVAARVFVMEMAVDGWIDDRNVHRNNSIR